MATPTSYSWGVIITIIVVVIIGIIAVVALYFASEDQVKYKSFESLRDQAGASTTAVLAAKQALCESSPRGTWLKMTCHCEPGYAGHACDKELRGVFQGVGRVTDLNLQVFSTAKAEGNNCVELCTGIQHCDGFVEHGEVCHLFSGSAEFSHQALQPHAKNNLFVRSLEQVAVVDRIYLAMYVMPKHYYEAPQTDFFRVLEPGKFESINFLPNLIINAGNYHGLYSLSPLTEKNFKLLLQHRPYHVYLHVAGEALALPENWKHRKLYLRYFK